MNTPTVSIITPTYNHESFIANCIESVRAQTFSDWEQIVIDDGSTDNTVKIVEHYVKLDPRIRLFAQNHYGIEHLRKNYNLALDKAKGDFLAILEGDDFWPSYKLQKQISLFDSPEVVLVWGRAMWVDQAAREICDAPRDIDSVLDLIGIELLRQLLLRDFIPAVTVMLRKSALRKIGGFKQPSYYIAVDYPTWLALSGLGRFKGCKDIMGYWRRHPKQMSCARQHDILKGAMKLVSDTYNYLPDDIKSRLGFGLTDILGDWYSSVSESGIFEGRKKLIKHLWQDAREEFKLAFKYGGLSNKIKALLGILATYGHCNLEMLAVLLGKDKILEQDIWD